MFGRRKTRQPRDGLRPIVAGWERGLYDLLWLRNQVGYTIADKVRGPQAFVFRLRLLNPGDLEKTLRLGEQLALALNTHTVRVGRQRGLVDVEITLPNNLRRVVLARRLERRGSTWVNLGQTATGVPVHVDLGSNRACHALVTGSTGCGKTVAQSLIAWTLAVSNEDTRAVNLLLIDGKGGAEWWGFDREAHLAHPIIGDPREAVEALAWTVAELDRRKTDRRSVPHLFIIVDEVRDLIEVGGEGIAGAIQRIAELGRSLGVHLVVSTQHALTDAVGGSIAKANLPLRLTGQVSDANAAYVATGVKGSGAEDLRGNGDFLLAAGSDLHRFQVALLGNREFGELPRVEETPTLDFGSYDLDRVLDVTDGKATPPESEEVAYALVTGCGTPILRERFGVGTKRAQRIRDYAQEQREVMLRLGYIPAIPVDCLSKETARNLEKRNEERA